MSHNIDMENRSGGTLNVLGALCVLDKITNTSGCDVNITAAPSKAAIEIWPDLSNPIRWSPAADTFFRSIRRN